MDVTTTTPAPPAPIAAPRRTAGATIARIAFGALGGFVLGVAARLWMRLISTEPEFSWHGTANILVGFTWFGGWIRGAAILVRSPRRRRRVLARCFAVLGMVPLFGAAGAVMLPTVAVGTWLALRPPRRWPLLLLLGTIAAAPVVLVTKELVDEFGVSPRGVAAVAAMLLLYGAIIAAARPAFSAGPRRRPPDRSTAAGPPPEAPPR